MHRDPLSASVITKQSQAQIAIAFGCKAVLIQSHDVPDQFFNLPDVIGETGHHCRRVAKFSASAFLAYRP
jgi:hypothetical protein